MPVAGKRPRASTVTTDLAAFSTAAARLSEYFCASLIVRSSSQSFSLRHSHNIAYPAAAPLPRSAAGRLEKWLGRLSGDQAAPDGDGHRLGPRGGAELGHGRAEVKF